MTPTAAPREVDCVIVGGGAAGLSAAVNMGRMRRSVLLIDERDRFIWKHVAHNYLGFPDGIQASEIRRLGWRQAAKYGVQLLLGHVATATREGDGSGSSESPKAACSPTGRAQRFRATPRWPSSSMRSPRAGRWR